MNVTVYVSKISPETLVRSFGMSITARSDTHLGFEMGGGRYKRDGCGLRCHGGFS